MRPPPQSQPEVHIAGVLVQARPDSALAVTGTLSAWPQAEVRAIAADKLVVVCEAGSGEETLALLERMRGLPGVLDVALVYQHAESAGAMQEEISDETDTP